MSYFGEVQPNSTGVGCINWRPEIDTIGGRGDGLETVHSSLRSASGPVML